MSGDGDDDDNGGVFAGAKTWSRLAVRGVSTLRRAARDGID